MFETRKQSLELKEHNRNEHHNEAPFASKTSLSLYYFSLESLLYFLAIFAAAARVRPRLPAEPKGSPSLANATNTWVWRCAISISRLRASIVLSSDKNRIAIRAKRLPNIGRRSGWNGKRVAEVW